MWAKAHDNLWTHPKWLRLSHSAQALWITALSYCADRNTFGFVHGGMIEVFRHSQETADELVAVGLWERAPSKNVAPASTLLDTCQSLLDPASELPDYCFKDWDQWQSSRAEVEAKKEAKKAAGRAGGLRKAANQKGAKPLVNESRSSKRVAAASRALADGKQTPSKTYPDTDTDTDTDKELLRNSLVRPTPTTDLETTTKYPPDFEAFWAAYPNKVAKTAAAKAFTKATRTTPATAITNAAHQYAKAWAEHGDGDKRFIPHPATWLNRGSHEAIQGEIEALQARNTPTRRPIEAKEVWQMTHNERAQMSLRNTLALNEPPPTQIGA